MPIVFVVAGSLLLLTCFNIIDVRGGFNRLLLEIFLVFVLLSYYVKFDNINSIYFNWFQVMLALFLIIFCMYALRPKFYFLIFTAMISILFFLVCEFGIIELQVVKVLIMVSVIFASCGYSNLFKTCLVSVINAMCLEVIYVATEYDEFTFAIFDTNLIFEIILICCVLNLIKKSIVFLSLNRRSFYVKKANDNFDFAFGVYTIK